MTVMFWTLVYILSLPLVYGFSNTGERSIRSSILSSFAYDRMARPSESTAAYVGFNLLAINDLDISAQQFVCSGWFTVLWNDNRLRWKPAIYDDTEYIHALESEIWKPEVLVDNSIEDINLISDDHLIYRIKYNGDVEWEPPVSEKVYCSIDVTYWPFDTQTCTLELVSWGLPKPELLLYNLWDSVNFNEYRESGSWEILSSSVNESHITVLRRNNTVERYSQVSFTFTLTRKPGLYILNTIIPVVMTSYLILVAFLVPAGSGEKMTFAAVVLAVQSILVATFLEQVPDISVTTSVLSQYLAANLCVSGACAIICAVISQVHHHPVESKISLVHKIIIIILKKLTLWCDPDPPEVEEEEEIEDETFVRMRTDDLRKYERREKIFAIKKNAVQPDLIDGFTETIDVKDKALFHIPEEFKIKIPIPDAKKKVKTKKIMPYNVYNWDTVAKVWDRFFFILGGVAITLFHLAFVNILRFNG